MAGCVRFEQLDQRFGSRLALLHCRQSVDCRRQDSVTDSLPNLLDLLRADGVVRCATARLTPLAGGVSSEIYRVDDGSDSFVVKRALPKLKVAADWFADPGAICTSKTTFVMSMHCCPDRRHDCVFASREHCYFAMELLGGDLTPWKADLLSGQIERRHAATAGRILGTIHRRSADDPAAIEQFATTDQFWQLRIEPYLLATAAAHPRLAAALENEARRAWLPATWRSCMATTARRTCL